MRIASCHIVLATALGILAGPALADDREICATATGEEAIAACGRLIASGKGSGTAVPYRNRCLAWNNKGEHERAIADCSEAIRLDPKFAAAYSLRGSIRMRQRDFDRAIDDYGEAIRIDPKLVSAYVNRGNVFRIKRQSDQALADLNEAIRLAPGNAAAYNSRGLVWMSKRDFDRAIADYDEAIKLAPRYAVAHQNRGIAWADKGQFDRAIADYDEAIRLDADFIGAYTNRGLAFQRKGEPDRARAEFETALAKPEKYDNGKWAHETARERLAALAASDARKNETPRAGETRAADARPDSPPPASAEVERRIALVLANAKYPDADAPLAHPIRDARALAEELRRYRFEVELLENLSKQRMRTALENFKTRTRPGTAALLYFSGFAIQSERHNYLIPVDAQIWTEADVRRDGIGIEPVLADLRERGAAVKLVIIDASRRNPFERRFRQYSAGLASIDAPPDTLVLYAAAPGQVANESGGEQSLFIAELIKEMRAPRASAEEIFKRTRITVSRASNSEQIPWVSSSLVSDFQF
jgi:tetratricopeptide (TPR) repeat protein